VKRTVNSGDFTNYWRALGNNANPDPTAAQLVATASDPTYTQTTATSPGLWMNADNASSINVPGALQDQANADLKGSTPLLPAYVLTLTPGWYTGTPNVINGGGGSGVINMGDTVPLVINRGRLSVNTTVRVLGLTFAIGEDDQEDISLTVSNLPAPGIGQLIRTNASGIAALSLR